MHTPSLPGRHFEEADRSHTAITVLQLLQGIHCERRSRPRLQGEFNGWPSWLGLESRICQSSMNGWEEQSVQGTAYHITQDVYRCKLEGILYGWQALRWPASQQSNCRIKVRSGPCKGSNQNVESLDNSPIMIWYATSYSGKPLQLPIVVLVDAQYDFVLFHLRISKSRTLQAPLPGRKCLELPINLVDPIPGLLFSHLNFCRIGHVT